MVSKLKILKNKEQRRAVSTAEFIRNLLLKEANESWPVAQRAAERCARSRRQGARHSRERTALLAGSWDSSTATGAEKSHCWKGPRGKQSNSGCECCCAKHGLQPSKLLKGNVKVALPLGYPTAPQVQLSLSQTMRGHNLQRQEPLSHQLNTKKLNAEVQKVRLVFLTAKLIKQALSFPFFFLTVCYTSWSETRFLIPSLDSSLKF